MKGHTGAMLSLGKGGIYSGLWKQRLVACSSTESELIGVYDVLPQVLWMKQFLEEHGWKDLATVIYQDIVEFWGLPPLILFFNMSTGWFGRFVLSTGCYRTRKLGYRNLNWPRCSAQVADSLALTDGSFCQK